MSSLVKVVPFALVLLLLASLGLVGGCEIGDTKCDCSVDSIEFPLVRAIEDTLTSRFVVQNAGEGDRMAFTIEQFPEVGLTIDESPLYVLDNGERASYTLRYAPQDTVRPQIVAMRVGTGADCLLRVDLGGAAPPRPLGACCFGDGTCDDGLEEFECNNLGGRFKGVDTTCDDIECTGACCLLTGDCAQDTLINVGGGGVVLPVSSDACANIGGIYQGDGTVCESTNCPQPRPQCDIAPTSFEFAFTLQDLIDGNAAVDTLIVSNPGDAVLVGETPFALNCGNVTFVALTNAGENGEFFVIPPRETAQIQITALPNNYTCDFSFGTDAPPEDGCPTVSVTARLDLRSMHRADRR